MVELADKLFNKFSHRQKRQCIFHVINLFKLINAGHGLSNQIVFIPDTNILISLEHPEKSSSQVFYCAIIFTFRAICKLNIRYKILVTPAVFWEFCHKEQFETIEHQYQLNKKIVEVVNILSVLKIPIAIHPSINNVLNYSEVKYRFNSDVNLIRRYLAKFKEINLKDGLNRTRGIPLIFSSAMSYINDNLNENDLKYLEKKHVSLFLASQLNEMIIDVISDQEIKKINNDTTGTIELRKKIIKFNNGEVEGVGDIELLSFCDIGSQFHHQTRTVAVGLTFEVCLTKLLLKHSNPVIGTGEIYFGIDTPQSANLKFKDLLAKRRKSDNQCLIQHKLVNEFYDEIEKISCIKLLFDYERKAMPSGTC